MCSFVLLMFFMFLGLFVHTKGNDQLNGEIIVRKCCGMYKMIGRDGKTCVEANCPRSPSFKRTENYVIFPPLDEDWVRRWLPPGLPLEKIDEISLYSYNTYQPSSVNVEVNSSSVWNEKISLDETVWRRQVVFLEEFTVARPKPGGGMRKAEYCIDAATPPLGPYVLLVNTLCSMNECVKKCCQGRHVLVNETGEWKCHEDEHGNWSPFDSPIAKYIDHEYPHGYVRYIRGFGRLHLANPLLQYHSAPWARSYFRNFLFTSWITCFDYLRENGTLEEGLFYVEYPRVARGIYWILRPLCVVTTILVAATLLSIACNRDLRRKEYGWCLVSHALCLFGFNVGQVVYYVAMSDTIDVNEYDDLPFNLKTVCRHLALWMYFCLLAAWVWLTVLCVNIALGFRLQVTVTKRSRRKKFLVFSVIAWGVPAVMTAACSILFTPVYYYSGTKNQKWFSPSLAECRVCYNEPYAFDNPVQGSTLSHKYGTALFFFGPVGCLMICNLICLVVSLRKVQSLKRGTMILRREEDLRRRQKEGSFSSSDVTSGDEQLSLLRNGGSRGRTVDAKTIKLYIKMVLMTGVLELTFEIVIWATTHFSFERNEEPVDYHYPYRSSGYVTDFLRAACVAWLAAPEGGYLGPFLRRLRGDKK